MSFAHSRLTSRTSSREAETAAVCALSTVLWQVLWSAGTLARGVHTVWIVREDADGGTALHANLDAVDIWGAIQ